MRSHAAKLFVVDQLLNFRLLAANRALRILAQFELAELHRPRVKQQQTIDQQIFRTENDLDRFVCLDRPDNARQYTEHTTFRARRHEAGRRRLRIQAAIARALLGPEDARLTFKPENRAVDVWLAAQHTRVVHEIARGKVVSAVDDDVVVAEESHRVVTRETRLVRFDLDVRIDIAQTIARAFDLATAEIFGAVNDLSLKVRLFNHIEVDDADAADTGCREIHSDGRAESASSDHQHARCFQFSLPLHADLGHDQVTAVAQDLLV